jgi:hypothetical protein
LSTAAWLTKFLHQGFLAFVVATRVGEVDLRFGETGLGKVELGVGLIQCRTDIGVVELGDDLAGLDVVALLDVELDHLCRILEATVAWRRATT